MIANRFLTSHQPIWIISNFHLFWLSTRFFENSLKIEFLDNYELLSVCDVITVCTFTTYTIKVTRNRPFLTSIPFLLYCWVWYWVKCQVRGCRETWSAVQREYRVKRPSECMALLRKALQRDVIRVLLSDLFSLFRNSLRQFTLVS